MPAGSVQTVLECVAISDGSQATTVDTQVCPPSGSQYFHLQQVQAYVIDPGSASYIDAVTQPIDYGVAAGFWLSAFTGVLTLFFVSRGIGAVLAVIRR